MCLFQKNKIRYPIIFIVLLLSFVYVLIKSIKKNEFCCFKYIKYSLCWMRAAPKVMPPIFWCRWDGSRDWTFPPIFHYLLLSCDRWQQRGSLTEWHLTWKGIWSRSVTEFLYAETMALTDINQCLLNVEEDQTVSVSTMRWWVECFSSVISLAI